MAMEIKEFEEVIQEAIEKNNTNKIMFTIGKLIAEHDKMIKQIEYRKAKYKQVGKIMDFFMEFYNDIGYSEEVKQINYLIFGRLMSYAMENKNQSLIDLIKKYSSNNE